MAKQQPETYLASIRGCRGLSSEWFFLCVHTYCFVLIGYVFRVYIRWKYIKFDCTCNTLCWWGANNEQWRCKDSSVLHKSLFVVFQELLISYHLLKNVHFCCKSLIVLVLFLLSLHHFFQGGWYAPVGLFPFFSSLWIVVHIVYTGWYISYFISSLLLKRAAKSSVTLLRIS